MNGSIEYYPGFFYATGTRAVLPAFYVVVDGDSWSFTFSEGHGKQAYERAGRFERLLSLGYAPKMAYKLSSVGICPTLKTFEREFEKTAHGEFLPVALAPEGYVSILDIMVKPCEPLTPDETERLFQMWLEDGDEIFHFESAYFDDIDIPGLLAYFRALAQAEDEIVAPMHPAPADDDGSFDGFSHHIGFIPY